MRKAVTFNPHWIDEEPACDVRLLNGDIHRGVKHSEILKVSTRQYKDVVRACDVADYGEHHLNNLTRFRNN